MQRSDYTMSDLLLYNDNSEGNLFALTEELKEEGGIFPKKIYYSLQKGSVLWRIVYSKASIIPTCFRV